MTAPLYPITGTAVIRNIVLVNPDPTQPAIVIEAKWWEEKETP